MFPHLALAAAPFALLFLASASARSAAAAAATSAPLPAQLFSPLIPLKVSTAFGLLPTPEQYPQYTDPSAGAGTGKWLFFSPNTWTSGFFPATGYALNARRQLCGASPENGLGTADWLALGRAASTALLGVDADHGIGHDVGFISFPFGEELLVNPQNETAKNAVNRFATMLAARFNPTVGCTRSWDTSDPTDFQVIIDNMMNLDVLFQSADLTGNATLRTIATTHADTTMKNHIREDGSTWHVIEYNSTTGAVLKKRTAQGFADNSTWSRGQAWGVYGFANMYKRTNNTNYLTTARRLATYFLDNLPADGIVPWDFNAPLTPPPRPADSSAATIVANGLLLLAQQETTASAAQRWTDSAVQILNNITALAWDPAWQSVLANGTVNWPANNSLTGIVYGDYYYIKAGNELVTMGLASCQESDAANATGTAAPTSAALSENTAKAQSSARRLSAFSLW